MRSSAREAYRAREDVLPNGCTVHVSLLELSVKGAQRAEQSQATAGLSDEAFFTVLVCRVRATHNGVVVIDPVGPQTTGVT